MKKTSLFLHAVLSLAALTSTAQAQDAKPKEAQVDIHAKAAMCMGCHNIPGYQASFPQVHKVPMLAGQSAAYIQNSLAAYKKGDRKHATMQAMAASLTDKDMADLAAFYEQQKPKRAQPLPPAKAPSEAVATLLKKGACVTCHGADFSRGVAPGAQALDASYPRLAGQHPDYLYVALRAYKMDNNIHVGRNNAIMKGMAKLYTDKELKQLADYIGSLPGELDTAPQSRFR